MIKTKMGVFLRLAISLELEHNSHPSELPPINYTSSTTYGGGDAPNYNLNANYYIQLETLLVINFEAVLFRCKLKSDSSKLILCSLL